MENLTNVNKSYELFEWLLCYTCYSLLTVHAALQYSPAAPRSIYTRRRGRNLSISAYLYCASCRNLNFLSGKLFTYDDDEFINSDFFACTKKQIEIDLIVSQFNKYFPFS